MNNYILTYFHHRGCVVGNPNPTYQREVDVFGVCIDKNHFTLVDLLSYTKDLGYTNVKGFYCEDNNESIQVTYDIQLLEFVKGLIDGDELHVYVVHEIDELEELPAPTGLLTWYDHVDEYVDINTEGTVKNEMKMIQMLMKNYDPLGIKEEKKRNHNLRKKRNPTPRKKKTIHEEVPIGEAGVDIGFEYIGINKKDRYVGRLEGDDQFNQPTSTISSNYASSTTVCGDTVRVKRARETAKSSQPPLFVDTSITVIKGIISQLHLRTRQTVGQKKERVATGEDFARGGPKRPTNGGSSNVGFGIYTSASGIQILNPGTSSQRILPTGSSYKDASSTGIDLGFKPRGLRWKNKDVVATSQLQQMANKKKK
ncbi:hypothetical protein H5410_016218 [Solanum commersonii]|uniref:Transposon MuDR mudrA n=1 Tax=Solanum commersonii TaxID=4109 RepID=A0A9J5ZWR5_SOLCO|nr:hypothetical protein H5410_016218 [Solanum commersonii]